MIKAWQDIKVALENPKEWPKPIYYAGATLCVDMPTGGFVAMNLDGKGFTSAGIVYIPNEIIPLVESTYNKYKRSNN